jgi:hypothetical protein
MAEELGQVAFFGIYRSKFLKNFYVIEVFLLKNVFLLTVGSKEKKVTEGSTLSAAYRKL